MSQQSREHSLLRSPAPQNNVVFFAGAQVLPSSPENCGSETSLRAISTSKTKTKEPAASTIDDVQSAMQLGGSLGASGFLNNIKVSSGGGDTSGSITDEEMFTPCAGGGTARGGADGDVDVEEGGETDVAQNTSTLYVEDSRYSDANSTAFGGAAELDADTNVKYMRVHASVTSPIGSSASARDGVFPPPAASQHQRISLVNGVGGGPPAHGGQPPQGGTAGTSNSSSTTSAAGSALFYDIATPGCSLRTFSKAEPIERRTSWIMDGNSHSTESLLAANSTKFRIPPAASASNMTPAVSVTEKQAQDAPAVSVGQREGCSTTTTEGVQTIDQLEKTMLGTHSHTDTRTPKTVEEGGLAALADGGFPIPHRSCSNPFPDDPSVAGSVLGGGDLDLQANQSGSAEADASSGEEDDASSTRSETRAEERLDTPGDGGGSNLRGHKFAKARTSTEVGGRSKSKSTTTAEVHHSRNVNKGKTMNSTSTMSSTDSTKRFVHWAGEERGEQGEQGVENPNREQVEDDTIQDIEYSLLKEELARERELRTASEEAVSELRVDAARRNKTHVATIDKLGEVQNALVDRGRELERLLLAHSTLEKENTRLRKQAATATVGLGSHRTSSESQGAPSPTSSERKSKVPQTLSTLPELQQQNEALRRKIAHGEQVVRRLVAEKTSVIADKKRLESTVMVLQQQLSHASKSYVQGGEAEMLKKHLIGMKREFLATVTTLQRESAGLKAALEEARQENKELKTERDIWRVGRLKGGGSGDGFSTTSHQQQAGYPVGGVEVIPATRSCTTRGGEQQAPGELEERSESSDSESSSGEVRLRNENVLQASHYKDYGGQEIEVARADAAQHHRAAGNNPNSAESFAIEDLSHRLNEREMRVLVLERENDSLKKEVATYWSERQRNLQRMREKATLYDRKKREMKQLREQAAQYREGVVHVVDA
eukprot:CAMPEP_0178985246 /NCGR_PEP_ID=MMETSP0795-20121207/2046_1 /TAXON_ID=88552 /ORGANISM="Amoebophrya sp., Strain Ameob2" /LENGTH=943 /DNA_ID=CAMNT_0020676183 /DNA_START=64 /DNA_END=2896 /DNA_ORIENTATION=-